MKEAQLHYFWERSLLPKTRLRTVKGERIQILSKGTYNQNESGPDFFNARIAIDDLIWVGNVEIHIKSSDWKKHGHQNDPSYDNVILHVVFEHDAILDPQVSSIPTLAISQYFDANTITEVANGPVINNTILCKDQLHFISDFDLVFIKEQVLYERLYQRISRFDLIESEPQEVLYQLIAEAFGRQVNVLPFQQLSSSIQWNRLNSMDAPGRYESLTENVNESTSRMKVGNVGVEWKSKGLRPQGSPALRIRQFAAFVSDYDFNYQFIHFKAEDIYTYLMQTFESRSSSIRRLSGRGLSKDLQTSLIINAFSPFMFWFGQHIGSESIVEKSMELLRIIPAEDNYITRIWKKTPANLLNAADSQAHLAIYKQFCMTKKCQNCPVGKRLLSE